ncbi:MAG: class I SAM-dependent methyltransferase [bacterium]|nr:class I SAM-dependent methyltransferase [bacterium]
MKFHSRFIGLLVGLVACCALLPMSSLGADDAVAFSDLTSPDEIQAFREAFINDFERTSLNTTPGDARFLRIIIASANLKRGIEVGTATGFGAINMGMAFERNGGELFTIDIDPDMVVKARENLAKVGLDKTVKVVEGDALKMIPTLEGKFDFLFLDALKQDYMKYFKLALPMLKAGAVIVADNVVISGKQMKDFLDFMENDPNYDMQIIRCSEEKGDGMAIIYKIK